MIDNGEEDKTHLFHTRLLESTGDPHPAPKTARREDFQAKTTGPRPPNPNNSENMAPSGRFYDFDNPEFEAIATSRELKLYRTLGNNRAARDF